MAITCRAVQHKTGYNGIIHRKLQTFGILFCHSATNVYVKPRINKTYPVKWDQSGVAKTPTTTG
jgi:hypothetical protein